MRKIEPIEKSLFSIAPRTNLEILKGLEKNGTPDIAVMLALLEGESRLVNLAEWLEAFSAQQDPSTKGVTYAMRERFVRCLNELQAMGIVHPTTKRPDHVVYRTMP